MEKKIKILTVIRHPVGGLRTYLKYTYGHLNPDKYQFTVVTVEDDEAKIIKKDLSRFDLEIIEIGGRHRIPLMIYKIFSLLGTKRFDIIHSQGFTAGIFAVIANIFSRVTHVITSHDVFREDQFSSKLGFLKKKCLGVLLSRADVIQSVSHDAQNNLVSYFPALSKKKDRLTVILNGISTRSLSQNAGLNPSSFRKEIALGEEVILFGFLGRFMPQKGFVYLIDAVEALSKDPEVAHRFKVVAVNDGAFIREYKAIVQEKGLSDYFIFYGFTPHVDRIMQALNAVVIPSLWEACPLLPMEAFVLGCPVIASECIGLREVVSGTPASIVKMKDGYSIAEKLKEVIHSPARIKQAALEYAVKAVDRFDVRYSAERLDQLFDVLSAKNK